MNDDLLEARTELRVLKPPSEVFEAIVNPDQMSGYFISSGTDRLDSGKAVTWKWDDVGVQLAVTPKEIRKDRLISFAWSASGMETKVAVSLEPHGDSATSIKISESGWPSDPEGTARCMGQIQGWVHMLCCLKAYLEYGINLRTGGVVTDGGHQAG